MPCKKCPDGKYKYGNTGECKYDTKEECDKANPNKYNKMKEYPTPLGKKTYEEYEKELKEFNLSAEPKLEKIELTAITELEEYEYELDKGREDLMKFATDAREAIAKGVRELNRLDAVNKVANRILGDVEKAAKDLGVDVPQIKALKSAISAYEQQRKSLTKVLK
tara:strand:- start:45 stop:539 length:495 start_codon:yes stop_codon:yes gene_type:complete